MTILVNSLFSDTFSLSFPWDFNVNTCWLSLNCTYLSSVMSSPTEKAVVVTLHLHYCSLASVSLDVYWINKLALSLEQDNFLFRQLLVAFSTLSIVGRPQNFLTLMLSYHWFRLFAPIFLRQLFPGEIVSKQTFWHLQLLCPFSLTVPQP